MGNDPIEIAAKGINEDEARILAHYGANENAGDIAITLEMDRNIVVRVIREKGRDNRTYSKGVALAWDARRKAKTPAVMASGALLSEDAIGVPRPQPAGLPLHQALRMQPGRLTSIASGIGATTASAARPVPQAAPPRKAVKRAAPAVPPVQEETVVATEPETELPRAADLPLDPPAAASPPPVAEQPVDEPEPEPADAEPVTVAETFEAVLARAESCGNADVELVARNLRADLTALVQALDIAARAKELETQIGDLDQVIAEKTSQRDELRRQLEELMSSPVMVSAASGHLRTPVVGDPDDATLRAWGTRNGFRVAGVGRVPGAVLIAYRKAHGLAA